MRNNLKYYRFFISGTGGATELRTFAIEEKDALSAASARLQELTHADRREVVCDETGGVWILDKRRQEAGISPILLLNPVFILEGRGN